MPSNFFWVEARSLPFKVFSFYEPVEELILSRDALGKVKDFFQALEYLTKKGLYALGFITYETGYLLEQRLTPLYRPPTLPLAHFLLFKKIKKEILFPEKGSIKF
ncbi:MAG: hypothetical protein ACK4GE_06340, partial [Caldimicrobium sp.]